MESSAFYVSNTTVKSKQEIHGQGESCKEVSADWLNGCGLQQGLEEGLYLMMETDWEALQEGREINTMQTPKAISYFSGKIIY